MERQFRLDHYPNIPERRRLQVFQISDIHLGAKTHLRKPFEEMINKIRKTRFTAVILHGDLLEANSKTSVGEGVYEQTLTPDEQLEKLVDVLKPIRGKILGISRGNHEIRASKNEGIDLINILCRQLDVPRLLSHSLHNFYFNDNEVPKTLCVWHGRSGATTRAGKMRVVEKVAKIYDADAYVMGHVHDLMTWMDLVYTYNHSKLKKYAINGSFMDYLDSYAQEAEYQPGVPGYITSMVGKDGIDFVQNLIPMFDFEYFEGMKIGGMK
jgi:predicted phosphodiesterase